MHWEKGKKEKERAREKEEAKDLVGRADSWDTNSGNVPKERAREERRTKDQGKAPNSAAAGFAVEIITKQSAPRERKRHERIWKGQVGV